MPLTKMSGFKKTISSLPDKPNDNMTSAELKLYFDSSPEELRVAHNKLIDELAQPAAATNIGVSQIEELSALTLQEMLAAINNKAKKSSTDLNTHANDSRIHVTEEQTRRWDAASGIGEGADPEAGATKAEVRAVDEKIGTLVDLETTDKTNIVKSVNEVKRTTATHNSDLLRHKQGETVIQTGYCANAEGISTTASGRCSHAQGESTVASGNASHAQGAGNIASGGVSHASGFYTTASDFASFSIGRQNKRMAGTSDSFNLANTAFLIGNGTSSGNLSNAFRVMFDGKVYGTSAYNSTGADYAEYFEWLDGNPNNEDRVGYFVTLERGKIRKVTSADSYILGVISSNPGIIGDSYQDDWNKKYVCDEWGRTQYHYVDVPAEYDSEQNEIYPARRDYVPILNELWDPDEEYIPRENRKEWDPVGLVGKLLVRDDGTCKEGGYCIPKDGGVATASNKGYPVMKRVHSNIILTFVK